MKFTLTVLFFAWLAMYCRGRVLSLPPSLITSAALVQRQHRLQQQLQPLWKKDTRFIIDPIERAVRRNIYNHNPAVTGHFQPLKQQIVVNLPLPLKTDNEYGLNALLSTGSTNVKDANDAATTMTNTDSTTSSAVELSPLEIVPVGSNRALQQQQQQYETQLTTEFFTPMEYWARQQQQKQCQSSAVYGQAKCHQEESYHSLLPDNNRQIQKVTDASKENEANAEFNFHDVSDLKDEDSSAFEDVLPPSNELGYEASTKQIIPKQQSINAIVGKNDATVMARSERNLIKFLYWALEHLNPYGKLLNISSFENGEHIHPSDLLLWKKLNLSGRLEPPLVVDEPHYIIVRREKLPEDLQKDNRYTDDPFIPPRGRKHDMPDLNALLNRYETFVPNRGRRADIKDILRSDDVFFPNRGKKALSAEHEYDDMSMHEYHRMYPALRTPGIMEQLQRNLMLKHQQNNCFQDVADNEFPKAMYDLYCKQQYKNFYNWQPQQIPRISPFKINDRYKPMKSLGSIRNTAANSDKVSKSDSDIDKDYSVPARNRRMAPRLLAVEASSIFNISLSPRSMLATAQRQVQQRQHFGHRFSPMQLTHISNRAGATAAIMQRLENKAFMHHEIGQ